MSESIPKIYPGEDSGVYYDGCSKGILYSIAINMSNKMMKQDGPASKKLKTVQNTTAETFSSSECISDTYVRNNPYETSDIMQAHWKNSSKKRGHELKNLKEDSSIQDIVNLYRTFGRSDGYYYVSIYGSFT